METESVNCYCCGLKEECTQDYITSVKLEFQGKWLCGLCSESVRDEVAEEHKSKNRTSSKSMEEVLRSHMSFCGGFRSNPAVQVADGMRQMLLRRRSGDFSTPPSSSSSRKNLTAADRKLY